LTARLIDPDWLPDLRKPRIAHKYSHGHALILSGGPGKGGAARLAARAALRIGAGAVTLLCPPAALAENAARLDAIMLDTCAHAAALREQLADKRVRVVLLGPALGLAQDQADLVGAALAGASECGVVLDADAITHLARDPILKAALHTGCVLTPHAGEFARLCPDIAARLDAPAQAGPAYSKLDATRDAARALGCTIVFKGPDTVIATPDGQVALHAACYDRAAPWLATAGSGDVLAGMICGLLARGYTPFDAACWGAWLHADCALAFGPGLTADDLPDMLPRVLAQLIARLE
jgi:hydroxyethylthiazole kinase-like uncharacterized protein yjeF